MVIDCGSALTFTATDTKGKLAGGAILPGVRLQLAALGTRTAQLPSDIVLPDELPPRQVLVDVFSPRFGRQSFSYRPPFPLKTVSWPRVLLCTPNMNFGASCVEGMNPAQYPSIFAQRRRSCRTSPTQAIFHHKSAMLERTPK